MELYERTAFLREAHAGTTEPDYRDGITRSGRVTRADGFVSVTETAHLIYISFLHILN